MELIYAILSIFGLIFLLCLLFKVLRAFYRCIYPYFIARQKDLRKLVGAQWAVVTGASDGIGKEYAKQLAIKGFNIVLISRSADKLRVVKEEIQPKQFLQPEVRWISFDFTNANIDDYEKWLFPELAKLDIGMLVNNVGAVHPVKRFHEIPGGKRKMANDLILNTMPHTILSAFVLKQMAERKKGIIINISSFIANYPFVYCSVYSSVKKYLSWFSTILRKEYSDTSIIIQTITPGVVYTKMSQEIVNNEKPNFFAPSPQKFVASALRTVGHVDEASGCFAHQLQNESVKMMPNWLLEIASRQQIKKLEKK
uniref:Steroid dehydrogenase n=1 Tax=Globodera rostochiensis TaxID=31243 RepID=A0A914HNJ6_GLORO